MDGLWREIARLQAALLDYDRVLQWHDCPWRPQILMHRNWDLEILGGLMRQVYA
jgi:hypothetical protein